MIAEDGRTVLVLARAVGDGSVAYQESILHPAQPVPTSPDSPFSELRVALYAASEASQPALVLTTEADLPMSTHGDVEQVPLAVGADQWLLVVSPRESLGGTLASVAPWLVLIGGILIALLMAAVTGVLSQRRAYALRLLDEQTHDLREAHEVAEEANRSKSRFLSRMSHELRTPLNSVLGFGQLLEIDELTENQRDAVTHIIKGGRHLLNLINEVLDISRIDGGELALSPEAVLASDLVADAIALMRPLAGQRRIQLVFDDSGACDCYVFADGQRSKQILLNLLSNAIKYNRMGGVVSISCTQISDARLQINVTDTGPGIAVERLGLLFTPFERLGAEHTSEEGAGIGLALSKRLAEVMGGTLEATSQLGRGSTFTLDLPRVEGPVERYERLSGPTSAPESSEGARAVVLHIEDNLANLALVERILAQRPEVEVVPAMFGRLGLELAHEHRPAIVLLDLHLPDLSGEEVLRRFRDDPSTAAIPIVIVSADATPGQIQRLLSAGAAAYLTKPLDVRQLLAVVDDALNQR